MLRVGVVGVGNMGRHHARVYSELAKDGRVEFIGVADTNFERAREIAKQYKVEAFQDYRELMSKVDAVSIVVPTSLHKQVALDFIENGVNVLVEKPIAESIESAEEIIRAAEKKDITLMVGHIERFNPAVLKLKEIIESNSLGEIVTLTAKRVGPFPPQIKDVGVIVDLAVHDIDVMSFLLGEQVKEVYAKAGSAKNPLELEDYAVIVLTFESATGVVETNWLTPHKVRKLSVVGTEGIAELDYINQELILYNHEWIRKAKIQKREPLRNEIEHFVECVEKGIQPIVSGSDGLHALKVAIMALKSAKEGKIIRG
ncbi:Gfo/Idh/MocA family oxidoreductase [Thermococcus sp. M39]|uniref:UDP-N-acetylglucosamine 3-dehydrogenase n=1 Tax=unclassified Thermococcus TaxID=2627626 RepID=UPI00143C0F2B|nr:MULTISPECIES: UDP-N-acetylglucosamine 3-dehydrogenase [unclassified Thermococcus]NJE08441.1 Gfo/Idh/MocA family oxidoreductase [Thermococcus sp. M39]NJE11944.1 Gfo/Idh/MocA family oxidoreductase [Thermococcus sp. LS2]